MSCSRSVSPRSVCAPQIVLSGFEVGIEQQEQRPLTPATVRKSTSLLSLQFSSPGVKDCSEDWASDSQEYYSDVDSDDEDEERAGVPVPLRCERQYQELCRARAVARSRLHQAQATVQQQ
uniref:Uncharacterized protein n=1 Tax=Tetradesmus obliquus TaxID=3088 RepID=A0A383WES1_TETOB|eukprot:jgi/Sobl393_1/18678/SZX75957.1